MHDQPERGRHAVRIDAQGAHAHPFRRRQGAAQRNQTRARRVVRHAGDLVPIEQARRERAQVGRRHGTAQSALGVGVGGRRGTDSARSWPTSKPASGTRN
jgi:hypothetical protein